MEIHPYRACMLLVRVGNAWILYFGWIEDELKDEDSQTSRMKKNCLNDKETAARLQLSDHHL